MPDWDAIQREYEAGNGSFQEIAKTHDVKRATFYEHSRKWRKPDSGFRIPDKKNQNPESGQIPDIASIHVLRPVPSPAPSPVNAVDIAQLGLKAILRIMKEYDKDGATWDLGELVKAANATTQFNRIIINALPERNEDANGDTMTTIDTQDLSPERLARLKAFAAEMREIREREGLG